MLSALNWTRGGLLLLLLAAGAGSAQPQTATPEGIWLTQDKDGVVRIGPCGTALCGWIAGLDTAPGQPQPTDFRGRPQCHLPLITNLVRTGPTTNMWEGEITDPRDGTRYDARAWIDREGRLRLRGYVLLPLFGATQIWTRYTGSVTDACRMVQGPRR